MNFTELLDGEMILDLCCGSGELVYLLNKQGLDINLVGIDISKDAIENAGKKNENDIFGLLVSSANILPFRSAKFNKSLVTFGLHHIPKIERLQALKEVHRVLVPEGIFYIIDYNLPKSRLRRLVSIIIAKLDTSDHAIRMILEENLVEQITQAGFKIEKQSFSYWGAIQMLKAVKK